VVFPENTAFAYTLIITVALTTAAWFIVTLLTPPESQSVLEAFYKRARPAGPGWNPIKERLKDTVRITDDLLFSFFDWIVGCALIYAVLFGIGKIILKDFTPGIAIILAGASAGALIYWDLSRRGWESLSD
jgi:SSS family solute:Na+ symporter